MRVVRRVVMMVDGVGDGGMRELLSLNLFLDFARGLEG